MKTHQHARNGFTLVEMSIVVLIIGLLISGVIAGKHFMRSAELRGALVEYDQYTKALLQFQNKYRALPGDFQNTSTVISNSLSNGDGNGRIGTVVAATGVQNGEEEWYKVWAHLAAANLIDGKFSGTSNGNTAVPGINVPASQVSGAGWTLNYYLQTGNSSVLWGDSYGHVLWFGGEKSGGATVAPVLTTDEARSIDIKLDDGKPGRGSVRAWARHASSPAPTCITDAPSGDATKQDTAAYDEDASGSLCSLFFITSF